MRHQCPNCDATLEISNSHEIAACPSCATSIEPRELSSVYTQLSATVNRIDERYEPELGSKIAHFRIDSKLGSGGFGSVYKAFDEKLERYVALKIPLIERTESWQSEIFVKEAQAAAQLQDPAIVSVFEIGRDENRVFIASELVEGVTMDKWQKASKPSQFQVASIIECIARAIGLAHKRKIVHRDLKPKNIIVDCESNPHVTDFGMAKRGLIDDIAIAANTNVLGTPAYMSPEQARGRASDTDGRSDIYSLGVVLYEQLTGVRPFLGQTDTLTNEILQGKPKALREIDATILPDLEAICLKAMALEPRDRFQTAEELADELQRVIEGKPTLVLPMSHLGKTIHLARTNWATIFSYLLLVGLACATLYSWTNPELPPDVYPRPSKIIEQSTPALINVTFQVSPANAFVRVVKYDYSKGHIDYQNVLLPDVPDIHSGKRKMNLTEGWYLLEAETDSGDVQEFVRFVPSTKQRLSNKRFRSTRFNNEDPLEIVFHPLKVISFPTDEGGNFRLGPEQFVEVVGGEFTTGAKDFYNLLGKPLRPKASLSMHDFYVSQTEVTFGAYSEVMGALPFQAADKAAGQPLENELAVGYVSWLEAVEYCERIGARLPMFEEYLYAATNGGTTKYPWGDKFEFSSWKHGKEGLAVDDVSKLGVRNLYSNKLEWTADFSLPLTQAASTADFHTFGDRQTGLTHSRLAVGGPIEAVAGVEEHLETAEQPTKLSIQSVNTHQFKGLGFRCYRSKTPRLKAGNPLMQYIVNSSKLAAEN